MIDVISAGNAISIEFVWLNKFVKSIVYELLIDQNAIMCSIVYLFNEYVSTSPSLVEIINDSVV